MSAFWIFLGGGLGSVARWAASGLVAQRFGDAFPWGTLIVNVTGCLALGLFATATATDDRLFVSPTGRQFFMVGLCGGYTTFSSFGLQTFQLAGNGQWLKAGANCVLSVVLCLISVWLGHVLALGLASWKAN